VARAPSPTKEALSLGLLAGELVRDNGGLSGALELTAEGRYLVRRMLRRLRGGEFAEQVRQQQYRRTPQGAE
jgi:hypothetical protein